MELTLGEVAEAVGDAEQSVTNADRSGDAGMRLVTRTKIADALHQAGRRAEAETRFLEAEQMQKEMQPEYPLLYSLQWFIYCDLLLAAPERAAWQMILGSAAFTPLQRPNDKAASDELERGSGINAALQSLQTARSELDAAVAGLRRSGQQMMLPHGLLTRAWLRFLTGMRTGPESAQEDLNEAWEIAERGPMKLFLADIHLHRARLFFREKEYPWNKSPDGSARGPKDDLDAAEKLITTCGYHRRDEELAGAKREILGRQ